MKTIKTNSKEQGITLVALVITIIIMLILAGVTLNIALGENGLFQMTKKAVEEYQNKANEEENALKGMEKELQYAIDGYVPDRSMLKVGDEVNYTPQTAKTTYTLEGNKSGYGDYTSSNPKTMTKATDQEISQENYTWKIMDINSKTGEVKIMGVPKSSHTTINFGGALGYNNGVYLINDICEQLYSNTVLGVKARSINLEDDIEPNMNQAGTAAKNADILSRVKNAEGNESILTKVYTESNAYYPKLFRYQTGSKIGTEERTKGIRESDDGTVQLGITKPMEHSESEEGYSHEASITVKQTFYKVQQKKDYYDDEGDNFYNLVFGGETNYWLATLHSDCYSDITHFGLRNVNKDYIDGTYMFGSNGNGNNRNQHICPIVSLGPDIEISREGNEGVWNLSKQ